MKLKDTYVARLCEVFPGMPVGRTVEAAFGAVAIHLDADRAVQNLSAQEQKNVLRRLAFHTQGHPCREVFQGLVLRELQRRQGHRIKHEDVKANRADQRAVKIERRRDRQALEASLTLPVSRLAAEAEHLAVLAALNDGPFTRTPEWRKTRWQAIVMAGSACSVCGGGPREGKRLVARHIVSRIVAPEKAFDLFNIRVRCAECDTGARTLRAVAEAPPARTPRATPRATGPTGKGATR